MSADFNSQMNAAALIVEADKYQACPSFQIEQDGSRVHCAECEQGLGAHIIVALRTAVAAHAELAAAIEEARAERPTVCPECDNTRFIEVSYNSDPTRTRTIYCDRCDEGIALNRIAAERDAALEDEARR